MVLQWIDEWIEKIVPYLDPCKLTLEGTCYHPIKQKLTSCLASEFTRPDHQHWLKYSVTNSYHQEHKLYYWNDNVVINLPAKQRHLIYQNLIQMLYEEPKLATLALQKHVHLSEIHQTSKCATWLSFPIERKMHVITVHKQYMVFMSLNFFGWSSQTGCYQSSSRVGQWK